MTAVGSSYKNWAYPEINEEWKERAACVDEDPMLWFPNEGEDWRHTDKTTRALTMVARAICNRCPVRRECLNYALVVDAHHGMYGGLTAQERAKMVGRKRAY